jgi:hypothetical protein
MIIFLKRVETIGRLEHREQEEHKSSHRRIREEKEEKE